MTIFSQFSSAFVICLVYLLSDNLWNKMFAQMWKLSIACFPCHSKIIKRENKRTKELCDLDVFLVLKSLPLNTAFYGLRKQAHSYDKKVKRKVLLKKKTKKEEKGTVTLHKASRNSICLYLLPRPWLATSGLRGSSQMQLALLAKICTSQTTHQNCVHLLQPQAGAWVYLEAVGSTTMKYCKWEPKPQLSCSWSAR